MILSEATSASDVVGNENFPRLSVESSDEQEGGIEHEGTVKRKPESDNEESKSKKRFVWPDHLHREFISAVFNVGLKFAHPTVLSDMIPVSKMLGQEYLKSHLLKFRLFRGQLAEISEDDSISKKCGGDKTVDSNQLKSGLHSARSSRGKQTSVHDREAQLVLQEARLVAEIRSNLRHEIGSISQAIVVQSNQVKSLQSSISRQIQLQSQLSQKLSQIDPQYTPNGKSLSFDIPNMCHEINSEKRNAEDFSRFQDGCVTKSSGSGDKSVRVNQVDQPPNRLPAPLSASLYFSPETDKTSFRQPIVPSVRSELQVMSEMRSHMDMHRQLLSRREDQLSLHGGAMQARNSINSSSSSSSSSINGTLNSNNGLHNNSSGDGISIRAYPSTTSTEKVNGASTSTTIEPISVAPHDNSEGLCADDWNWDTDESMDLFSFLLDPSATNPPDT